MREQLRAIRADIAGVKGEVQGVRERMDTMEAQLTGLTYLLTTGRGSVLHDAKDVKTRVAMLEGAR